MGAGRRKKKRAFVMSRRNEAGRTKLVDQHKACKQDRMAEAT